MALEGVIQVLDILTEAARMVPIAGDSLEGVCAVLLKICTIAKDVKDTKEEFMDLADYAAKTIVKVAGVIQKADKSKAQGYCDGLKDISDVLDAIVAQADYVNTRPFYRRLLGASIKTRKELESLRRRLTIACTQFGVVSQLQTQISVDELRKEVDCIRDILVETEAAERRAFCHQKLQPVHAEAHSASVDASVDYCHPATCTALLDEIAAWACSSSSEVPIYWISGLAGTGKSTVARTVCKRLISEPVTLANFFISVQSSERNDPTRIPGSLSYQLALVNPTILSSVSDVLHRTPDIVSRSISDQVNALLAEPLWKASPFSQPIVILLDALDECGKANKDSEGADLIPLLVQALLHPKLLRWVKLLVTSRESIGIVRMFSDMRSQYGDNILRRLESTDLSDVEHDIRCYLESQLHSIAVKHGLQGSGWPSDKDVDELCFRSEKLFIFAATIIRFLDSDFESPRSLLERILRGKSTDYESPYKQLDDLYTRALDRAVNSVDGREHPLCHRIRTIIGAILVVRAGSDVVTLAACTGLYQEEIDLTVKHLVSVLRMDPDGKVHIFHKSFMDFLTERCTDTRFSIVLDEHRLRLSICCLEMLTRTLATEHGINHLFKCLNFLKLNSASGVLIRCCRWIRYIKEVNKIHSRFLRNLESALDEYVASLKRSEVRRDTTTGYSKEVHRLAMNFRHKLLQHLIDIQQENFPPTLLKKIKDAVQAEIAFMEYVEN